MYIFFDDEVESMEKHDVCFKRTHNMQETGVKNERVRIEVKYTWDRKKYRTAG